MNISLLLLNQIFIMFIFMGIGFLFYKIGFITDQGSKDIAKILLYLVVPVVIVKNFAAIDKTPETVELFLHATLFSFICMVISIIVGYVFFGRKDGVAAFSTTFSNAGFIGIPLVQATLGEEAVFYISMMIVMINSLQWTYGIWMMSGDASVIKPKKIITNPIVISVIIGLIIFFGEIPMPSILTSVFTNVSNINTPLAMIVSGVYLAQSDLLKMFTKIKIYKVSLARLIIVPCITLVAFKLLPFGALDVKLSILICAACPAGSNGAMFASLYNQDYVSAVEQVCMTTILCLVTLPIIISFASTIL